MLELRMTPSSKEWKNVTTSFPGEGIRLTLFLKLLSVGVGPSVQRTPRRQVGEGGRMRRQKEQDEETKEAWDRCGEILATAGQNPWETWPLSHESQVSWLEGHSLTLTCHLGTVSSLCLYSIPHPAL